MEVEEPKYIYSYFFSSHTISPTVLHVLVYPSMQLIKNPLWKLQISADMHLWNAHHNKL